MAEVKNAFIKSKMNQDLDDRLIPSGEYREGFNIQVSKSQGPDVGALENVLGNQKLVDFESLTVPGIQIIGQFTNPSTNRIYFFLTTYEDTNFLTNPTYDASQSNYIYEYNVLATTSSPPVKLAEGAFLNFSTTNPIYGVNMIENLLFFTDNRNQPRRIDVNRRSASGGPFYTSEDLITVAQYAPFDPILVYKNSTVTSAANAPETTMYDVVSINLPNGTTPNPYFNASYAGDPDYLENKFIRFSYRFKFNSGEYSILAPFTQALFIPQQDGYFLAGDEESTYRSTIVQFMQNKVNRILLQIPIPSSNGADFITNFNVEEIDIIFKESDAQALYVVDTIDSATIEKVLTNTVEYDYQSKKPFKTLPSGDLIRVFDKVPVKALSQEITGNRVVYGNYQDKHTPPASLSYNVGISAKDNFDDTDSPDIGRVTNTTSIVEYPNHTLKQNRNYQVGVILSDRYGRSSTVILSTTSDGEDVDSVLFGASTVYNPYRLGTRDNGPSDTEEAVASWPGDALKVRFDEPIESSKNPVLGTPGLYNGDPTSSSYNPLGWYSYKIVVKQLEQEYYNVYLPGILNGYPSAPASPPDPQNTTAFITLINDNINKVPRDLSEVGPEQKQYRSSVQLYGRVTPNSATSPTFNQQYYPGQQNSTVVSILPSSDTVNTIAEEENILDPSTYTSLVDLYQTESNPYIGRITQGNTSNPIGSLPVSSGSYNFLLGVYETDPVVSRLEIFWETSTTGLISDLNQAIVTGTSAVGGLIYFDWSLAESQAITSSLSNNAGIAGRFAPAEDTVNGLQPLETSDLVMSVIDISGNTISKFILEKIPKTSGSTYDPLVPDTFDSYRIQTNSFFYFGPDANVNEVFYFTFVNNDTGQEAAQTIQSLANTAPTITNGASISVDGDDTGVIFTYTATNGSADPSQNTLNLTWSMTGNPPELTLDAATGELSLSDTIAGKQTLTISVQDAGGLTDTITSELVSGEIPINAGFGTGTEIMSDSGGASGAFYWTQDNSTAATATPLPGTTGGTVDIRAPYSGLSLTGTDVSTVTIDAPDCPNTTFSNFNEDSAGSYNNTGSLTQGTAFVAIEAEGFQYSYFNGQYRDTYPFVMYPVYLQYRDPSGAGYPNNWVQATDIEGKDIRFGGTQNNWPQLVTKPVSDLRGTGVLDNDEQARDFESFQVNTFPTSNTNINLKDCLQASVESKQTATATGIQVTARKVFAIGQSQQESYTSPPAKYGDYRLIVRYPWGEDKAELEGNQTVVGYGSGQCPVSPYVEQPDNFRCTLKFGDFYYPYLYKSTVSIPTSYSYQVSVSPQTNAIIATTKSTDKNLFAREWACKYVSQFYLDADLTQPWGPGSAGFNGSGWYGFRPVGADTDINVKYGTDNSFPRRGTGNQTFYPQDNQDRKWSVYLGADGIKSLGGQSDVFTVQAAIAPSTPSEP